MKKIVTIIGARPQIIKSAALSSAIRERYATELTEVIVHTGQHYDEKMSHVFYEELGLPKPNYNLEIGSGAHGQQTAKMIAELEKVLLKEQPQALVVYGDTNSTLAAAIAASKIAIPVVHIEAGLRSYNKAMPEEINRIMCDHVSTLLFSPTISGVENLQKEGFDIASKAPFNIDNPKIYHCGDIMYDNSMHFAHMAKEKSTILAELGLTDRTFMLATVHRPSNTDNAANLTAIFEAFLEILMQYPSLAIVLPLHPRTKHCMQTYLPAALQEKIVKAQNLKIIPPVSFLDVIALEQHSEMILTDSGGLQKEAYFFQKPCVILREETEWIEIVEQGTAILAGADKKRILSATNQLLTHKTTDFPSFYGDGNAAAFIAGEICKHC